MSFFFISPPPTSKKSKMEAIETATIAIIPKANELSVFKAYNIKQQIIATKRYTNIFISIPNAKKKFLFYIHLL